jgi:hypothetical protein
MRAMVLAAPGAPLQVQERDDPNPGRTLFRPRFDLLQKLIPRQR